MPKAVRVAVVAAIRIAWGSVKGRAAARRLLILLLVCQGLLVPLLAAVLPEDRSDVLYHSYRGGGLEVQGPSILLRKQIGKRSSLVANYYVDAISSASIDVITSASPYEERREEKSVGADFVFNKTLMSLGFTTSSENDFEARSAAFSISQDLFGDLTTVSLGYVRGWDEIGKSGDPGFSAEADRQRYRIGISQILTRDLIIALNFETVTDEGYLNNPYRSVRYRDDTSAVGYSFESEVYPRTRTSNAVALRGRYHLPFRASLLGEYRLYQDSWGIDAYNVAVGYTHAWRDRWLFDFRYRYYAQDHADFYSDLFPYRQAQNFLARDKELSSFTTHTFGLAASYEFKARSRGFIDRGSINAAYDRIYFDYENFRDLTAGGPAGAEPLYEFTADVLQLYLSVWY